MKKLRSQAIILSLLTVTLSQAQTWTDITEFYITNPTFDDNTADGWTYTHNATTAQLTYECMEFWNGTFNINQTITNLPAGTYRLIASAFYRTTDNQTGYRQYTSGTYDVTALLYAGETTTPLCAVYDYSLTTNYANGCWSTFGATAYYPNTMQTSSYAFQQGYYTNTLDFTLQNTQDITIGILNETYTSNNWCIFDNFTLQYYGTPDTITHITLQTTDLNLITGQRYTINPILTPTDAIYKKVVYESTDTNVATVDDNGLITANSQGQTTIKVSSYFDEDIYATLQLTVTDNPPTAASLIINEIQVANIDMFVDPSYNYGPWVELYNPTTQDVSLCGCYVSDNLDNPTRYRLNSDYGILPANGYTCLWFDHHEADTTQIDFHPDYDGGTLYISDPTGTIIATLDYPQATTRTSYARITDGNTTWGTTAQPTPGATNSTSTFATNRLQAPQPDTQSCLFTTAFTVNVPIPENYTLRYTTDGSTPTTTNGQTSTDGTFNIEQTTLLRLCFFADGNLPSQVVTRSYINETNTLNHPVISIVTDPINLYDDTMGVYVRGVNGRTGNGQSTPCNWNMDWDRPVNFEYIKTDGTVAINQETDFAMVGGWSRAYTPHSFKIKAAKQYEGLNSLDFAFFDNKPHNKHKALQIRNGGNDNTCRIKDPALQTIISTSGIYTETQSYVPTAHYINGQYMGLINMREPNNKHYAYSNYGYDDETLEQFEMSPDSGYIQKCGTGKLFNLWYDLSANADDEDTYAAILDIVDIDNYINYMAIQFYLGNGDWPQNNVKGFAPLDPDGRFRFVIFDLDGAFNTTTPFTQFQNRQTYTFDTRYDGTERLTDEIRFVTIFLNMLQNQNFVKQFIDTYTLVAGSVFEPTRCATIIDSLAADITDILTLENTSPSSTASSMKSSLTSRQTTMIDAMENYTPFNLDDATSVNLQLTTDLPTAPLLLNEIPVPTSKFSGPVYLPVTLRAATPAGYTFLGWSAPDENATTIIQTTDTWTYYDQGTLDGQDWTAPDYDTSTWKQGPAPLGYSSTGTMAGNTIATTLSYGTNSSDKYPTYYFRHTLTLQQTPTQNTTITLNAVIDDGFVFYVNTQEAARYNMPTGTPTYQTYASTYAASNPDNVTITLDPTLFQSGQNTIAVEVHNNAANSSDILWQAQITLADEENNNIITTANTYTLTEEQDTYNLTALYRPQTDDEREQQNLHPVTINEFSADNTLYINDYWKKNDWVELYNTTQDTIDVAGYYLSDNTKKPTKWQITADESQATTLIPPHDHLIIWCDKLDPITQLHATFKLDADGGDILLKAPDLSWTETITYEPFAGDQSIGRYADGNNDIYLMQTPTLGKANILTTAAQILSTTDDDNQTALTDTQSDNNTDMPTLRLTAYNTLRATSPHTPATLHIYAVDGIRTTTATLQADTPVDLTLDNLPRGIYIARLTTTDNRTATLKFVR